MMVLVTFRAVLARQLDAVALDAIDGADMCAVLADDVRCTGLGPKALSIR